MTLSGADHRLVKLTYVPSFRFSFVFDDQNVGNGALFTGVTSAAACTDHGICSRACSGNLESAAHHAGRKVSIMVPHPLIIEF